MKNINLMPRVPLIQKIFLPVILSIVGTAAISGASLFFYGLHLKNDLEYKDIEIKRLSASIQVVDQQRTEDQQTKDYQRFSAEVDKLKSDRRSWTTVLELITSRLPQVSRVTEISLISANNDGKQANSPSQPNVAEKQLQQIMLTAEFGELTDISEYVVRLQQSPLLNAVAVKSVQRVDGVIPPATETPPDPQITDPSAPAMTTEDYIKKLETSLSPAETEGDALLNQLRWTVNQQLIGQQYGIPVPDRSFVSPQAGDSAGNGSLDEKAKGTPITQQEINEARKQLEQFKSQNKTNPLPSSSANLVNPVQPEPVKYTKYNLQLELTLKPPSKEK